MSLVSVKIIKRPPPAQIQLKNIQQEISKQLQPVGRQHVSERKRIVANFDTNIEFGYRISTTQAQVTLTVVVENSDQKLENSEWTVGDLWKALDKKGTKPHDITPKNPQGRLRFLWGGPGSYQAKTRPVARFGGSGEVSGGVVMVRKSVKHPGFPPRKFFDSINKRLRRSFEQAIDRGVRLGTKRK